MFAYIRKLEVLPEGYINSLLLLINRFNVPKCARTILNEIRTRGMMPNPVTQTHILQALDSLQDNDPVMFLTLQREYDSWVGGHAGEMAWASLDLKPENTNDNDKTKEAL